ncbi:MAG TPA: hypothetical protein VMO17_16140, partial [Terriglobia bacterium]|nr:hypothetical protein [Terriglobia bacterium]
MAAAWGSVLQNPGAPPASDPALAVPQATLERSSAGDFLNHVFLETRTEYLRTQSDFSGQPTLTGVINAPFGPVTNPNGVPDPAVFQPNGNTIYSFLNWGTRGWLSDRINTNFSFRYQQDITHTDLGSPATGILQAFVPNREAQLLSGYIDVGGHPTDGLFSGSSLRLGRQDVYGAEVASFDGASFNLNREYFSYTVYGGRRFTYYSDPEQRAIGGGNFIFRHGNTTFEYDALFYVMGSHSFSYRQQFSPSWLLAGNFRMFGGSPTEASVDALWSPADGKTTLRLDFSQELTNKNYVFDYTGIALDLDPHNPLQRLNLEVLAPHSQFVIDARRVINSRLRVGGTVWVRRLNDSADQAAFDTSFVDYRGSAQIFPGRKVMVSLDYHLRNSDRSNPSNAATFDDISAAGETKVQDVSVEIGRSFGEGRFSFNAGGFYRLLNFQDSFLIANNATDKGVLGNAFLKLDQRTRMFVEY